MSDSDSNEKTPLLNKLSTTDRVKQSKKPKEVSRKFITDESRKASTSRNPYVVSNQLSSSLSDNEAHIAIRNAAQFNRYRYYAKLYSQSGSQLVIPDHVLPRECFWPIRGDKGAKQSSIITIFAIWNTMMGTSLLSMPWAIQQAGFVLGVTLIIVMGMICLFTCLLVVKSADRANLCRDYENEDCADDSYGPDMKKQMLALVVTCLRERCFGKIRKMETLSGGQFTARKGTIEFVDVCEVYLGKAGKIICFVFGLVAFLGAVIVYWVLMTNFLYNVGTYIYDHTHHDNTSLLLGQDNHGVYCPNKDPNVNHTAPPIEPSGHTFYKYWNQRKTVPFYLLLLLVPLSSLKSPTFFTKFNALGAFSVLYMNIFIITKAVQWGPHIQFTYPELPSFAQVASAAFPALTGILGLALYIHNAILSILATNEKPENNTRDVSLAYLCTTMTYSMVGIIFYVFFPLDKSCIEQVLLDNFVSSDVMTFIAQCGLLFQMTTVFPLLMYIIRVQIIAFFFDDTNVGYLGILTHNCGIISLGVLMAVFYPEVGHIIRYVGSVSAMVYIFTLPPVIKMILHYKDGSLKWTHVAFYSVFICIGVANFIAQFIVKDS